MSFETQKYEIIKHAITKDIVEFCYTYFLMKRDAFDFMSENNMLPNSPLRFFGNRVDPQTPGVYSHYGDFAMETLLLKCMPIVEAKTNLKLVPTYSYARIYEKGSELKIHTDRPSSEVAVSLNIGGDSWPLYLGPNIKIDLDPGDLVVYAGNELEHWRNKFEGDTCVQAFLMYNHVDGPFAKTNKFDGRPLLGLPYAEYEERK